MSKAGLHLGHFGPTLWPDPDRFRLDSAKLRPRRDSAMCRRLATHRTRFRRTSTCIPRSCAGSFDEGEPLCQQSPGRLYGQRGVIRPNFGRLRFAKQVVALSAIFGAGLGRVWASFGAISFAADLRRGQTHFRSASTRRSVDDNVGAELCISFGAVMAKLEDSSSKVGMGWTKLGLGSTTWRGYGSAQIPDFPLTLIGCWPETCTRKVRAFRPTSGQVRFDEVVVAPTKLGSTRSTLVRPGETGLKNCSEA